MPFIAGIIYYIYFNFYISKEYKNYKPTTVSSFLLANICLLVGMMLIGALDASPDKLDKNLSVVIFDEQKSYPSINSDWRLLENFGNKLVLINLVMPEDSNRYPIKIVDPEKIEEIY